MKKIASLSLIVPCFNEEDMLQVSMPKFINILKKLINEELISENSEILFIDDGSTDKTWDVINNYHDKYNLVKGLKLSKNFGHQNALLAGLMNVDTDVSISIDADLQDDPNVIVEMIKNYYEGYEIVYGVRSSREADSFIKRFFAQSYYKFLTLMKVDIIEDHADFRLMSRKALEKLADFKEVNLFLRGLIPLIGFKQKKVYYVRLARDVGETKYNLKKMITLALNGITSFSVYPLVLIVWLGFFISLISGFFGVWAIFVKFFIGGTVQGWTSIVVPIYFLGGVQLLTLGIIGIYLSKVYLEVKARPRYILEDEIR